MRVCFQTFWPLLVAFCNVITALKSHMTCYNLNLNSFSKKLTNSYKQVLKLFERLLISKAQLNNLSSDFVMIKVEIITGHVTFKCCYNFSKSSLKQPIWAKKYLKRKYCSVYSKKLLSDSFKILKKKLLVQNRLPQF